MLYCYTLLRNHNYVCDWTEKSFKAEKTQELFVGGEEHLVKIFKVDWMCRGFHFLRIGVLWAMSGQPCLLIFSELLHSSLPLQKLSESNRIITGILSCTVQHADEHGAWLIRESYHQFMTMRKREIEGMEYPEEFLDHLEGTEVASDDSEG